jgi:hypothetical protein
VHPQGGGAARQQEARPVLIIGKQYHGDGSRTAAVRRDGPSLESPEVTARPLA